MSSSALHCGRDRLSPGLKEKLLDVVLTHYKNGLSAKTAWKSCKEQLDYSVNIVSPPQVREKIDIKATLSAFDFKVRH